MNNAPVAAGAASNLLSHVPSAGLDVSWIGPSGTQGMLCFGTDDGQIQFRDTDGNIAGAFKHAVRSGEAVNGVAFLNKWMLVSSRAEMMLWELPSGSAKELSGAAVPLGSHGAIATSSGHLLAPLGMKGFMYCKPQPGEVQGFNISNGPPNSLCFYRMTSYRNRQGKEFVAFALRQGGLGILEFKGEGGTHVLNTHTFSGLDVVDVCTTRFQDSNGVLAIGKDRTLILMRDKDASPVTIRYESFEGIAYRILCARDYLFVLTSKALYVVQNLTNEVGHGNSHNVTTNVLTIPMEAVDIGLVGDRWLYAILTDRVQRLDISLLDLVPSELDPSAVVVNPAVLDPDWEEQEVDLESHSTPIAA